jgi:hypothetical protein
MNTPNPAIALDPDALSGDLRPSKQPPRPIPYPPTDQPEQIGGRR